MNMDSPKEDFPQEGDLVFARTGRGYWPAQVKRIIRKEIELRNQVLALANMYEVKFFHYVGSPNVNLMKMNIRPYNSETKHLYGRKKSTEFKKAMQRIDTLYKANNGNGMRELGNSSQVSTDVHKRVPPIKLRIIKEGCSSKRSPHVLYAKICKQSEDPENTSKIRCKDVSKLLAAEDEVESEFTYACFICNETVEGLNSIESHVRNFHSIDNGMPNNEMVNASNVGQVDRNIAASNTANVGESDQELAIPDQNLVIPGSSGGNNCDVSPGQYVKALTQIHLKSMEAMETHSKAWSHAAETHSKCIQDMQRELLNKMQFTMRRQLEISQVNEL